MQDEHRNASLGDIRELAALEVERARTAMEADRNFLELLRARGDWLDSAATTPGVLSQAAEDYDARYTDRLDQLARMIGMAASIIANLPGVESPAREEVLRSVRELLEAQALSAEVAATLSEAVDDFRRGSRRGES